jgi:disulfide bond formation protein DsbB
MHLSMYAYLMSVIVSIRRSSNELAWTLFINLINHKLANSHFLYTDVGLLDPCILCNAQALVNLKYKLGGVVEKSGC